jgi:hypothetical protein
VPAYRASNRQIRAVTLIVMKLRFALQKLEYRSAVVAAGLVLALLRNRAALDDFHD